MKLSEFAKHTRHTNAELNHGLSDIARKWIVAHVAGESAYHLIADDYEAVSLRTQDPPFAAYRRAKMDPETFVWVMRDGFANTPVDTHDVATPRLGAFCDALFPRDPSEERWQTLQRDDHWKPRAYFVAAQAGDHELVRAVTADDRRFPDLWSRISLYQQDVGGTPVQPTEWAAVLDGLTELREMPSTTTEVPPQAPQPVDEEAMVPDVVPAESNIELWKDVVLCPTTPVAGAMDWGAIRNHPAIREYRAKTLISPTAPTDRLFKQVVLRALGAPLPSDLLIANQDHAMLMTNDERAQAAELIRQHVRGHIPTLQIDASEQAHRSAYQAMPVVDPAMTPTEFLKTSLLYYIEGARPEWNAHQTHAFAAHMARYPKPHPALCAAVLSIH